MKRILTFIPLGVGISATIIYLFNVISFRIINNSATLMQILSNLKIYLYIAIAGYISYFLIKVLITITDKKSYDDVEEDEEYDEDDEVTYYQDNVLDNEAYEPLEVNEPIYQNNMPYNSTYETVGINDSLYQNNTSYNTYDKVEDGASLYQNNIINEIRKSEPVKEVREEKNKIIEEEQIDKKEEMADHQYCYNCESMINSYDKYCSVCGACLKKKKKVNPVLRNVINVIEIVILILILYFLLNMMFTYKEKQDPNFKSPFTIEITK